MEECCATRNGKSASNWHYRHKIPRCDKARAAAAKDHEKQRKQKAEAEGRTYISRRPTGSPKLKRVPKWTPGSSILVEEIEEL